MRSFRKWIQALRTDRCEKHGHVIQIQYRGGLKDSRDRMVVAYAVTQERPACRRCGDALGDWKEVIGTYFTSVTRSVEAMGILEREGYLWERGGFRMEARRLAKEAETAKA